MIHSFHTKALAGLRLVAVLALSGCAGGAGEEGETHKIGALFALSGLNSPVGTSQRDAILMQEEQINAQGGIKGKKLEVIIYDTKSEETKAPAPPRRA